MMMILIFLTLICSLGLFINLMSLIILTAPLWLMSFFDRDEGLAVTPDGLRCQSRDFKAWQGCRATKGVVGKGKYYYEATVADEGLCRVGFSTSMVIIFYRSYIILTL